MQAETTLSTLKTQQIDVDTSPRRLTEYSFDASNYRVRPAGVIFPKNIDECRRILAECSRSATPVTLRGGGTSMAGNAIGEGIILDMSYYMGDATRIAIDEATRSVWVEAGVVMSGLRAQVEQHTQGRLTFAPDPSSVTRATIGGSIGNDACGNHSVAYGRMTHHIEEIEFLTIDGAHLIAGKGEIRAADPSDAASAAKAQKLTEDLQDLVADNLAAIRLELDTLPRQVSGYHLAELLPEKGFHVARALAGSEGTCAMILRAKMSLVPTPGASVLLCAGYDSTVDSARDVMTMLSMEPAAVEGLDAVIVDIMRHRRGEHTVSGLPSGTAFVLVEFSEDTADKAEQKGQQLLELLTANGRLIDASVLTDPVERAKVWRIREDGAGLSSKRIDGVQTWGGWEDSAVAPENLADYLEELIALVHEYGFIAPMYGHFGAGCIHMRVDFDLLSDEGRTQYASFMKESAELVVRHRGSLSGEHGDGRARGELLPLMYSAEMMRAFARFKQIWDPTGLLNPGIIIDSVAFEDDLLHAGMPAQTSTQLHGPSHPDYALPVYVGEAHACIGVGRCRATTGGFMCPSYRATRDEKDSTRGRARVLQELVRSNGKSAGGWSSPEVREALDLCLSCKACASDCPTGVDIADAKSMLIDEHYRGKLRPFVHYSIGWLPRWIPLLTRVAPLANWGASLKPFRWLGELLGVSAKRKLPKFRSTRELRQRMREEPFDDAGSTVLFVDSFTRAFRPEVVPAAVRVLRDAGESVSCSPEACCGLTWVSTGQRVGAAKRLKNLINKLDDGSERDIVVLEPSCAATIRDEGPKLVPGEAAERVASRVTTFAGAAGKAVARGWKPAAPTPESVVLQTHCHEHSVFGPISQRQVLEAWGVPRVAESSSCCGVAGNFGFEAEHFDVSMKVAEHSIIPALQQGGENAIVLTDGFSCAMQVSQVEALQDSEHLATALDPQQKRDSRE